MGSLPAPRVTPTRLFLNTVVDYAGPFNLRTWRGRAVRTYKDYHIVFVYFATSAVHLELATDYSTQGFLAAYRQFISRRGRCNNITSDCGMNFVGADADENSAACSPPCPKKSPTSLISWLPTVPLRDSTFRATLRREERSCHEIRQISPSRFRRFGTHVRGVQHSSRISRSRAQLTTSLRALR